MPFSDGEIDKVIRDYICAQCYSDLRKEFAEDRRWLAVCPIHGSIEKVGRVTKKWAIRQGQKLAARRMEIEYYEPKELRDPKLILEELGF